jgi:hypothetical protein
MSLFDEPRPYLNPEIWTADNQLKPEVKKYLLHLLEKIFSLTKVYSLHMIGSSVSYQYGPDSDVDVNVIARKGEFSEYWHPIFKKFNNKLNYLPGTKNPVNFFFQEYTPEDDWSNSLGSYDILQAKWTKLPIPFDRIGDPATKYEREIAYGKMILAMIETKEDLAQEAVARGDQATADRIHMDLALYFKQVDDGRKAAYRFGAGTPALQEWNIIYKMIEHSKYGELFSQLLDFYDTSITPLKGYHADISEI